MFRVDLLPLLLFVAALTLLGCAPDPVAPTAEDFDFDTLTTEVLHTDLAGPTQFVLDGDRFVVATINGDENGGDGQIVAIHRETDERTVLLDSLDKPTGVAILDGDLWVMERDQLTRGPVGGDRQIIAGDLPNNGRSQGTLTITPDDTLLFNTSGRMRDGVVTAESGRIFEVDPATNAVIEVASGFKHAYAHAFTSDTVWAVEMSDGSFDGAQAADELVGVVRGADHGWPHCVGDRRVVIEFEGSSERCEQTPPSQAVFGPSATPTSIVVSPFADEQLLVALWREGRIVAVSTETNTTPQLVFDAVTELENPQHLVASSPGEEPVVYLTEFGSNSLLAIRGDG